MIVMEPPLAARAPLEEVSPVLRRSMVPPLAVSLEPKPTVVDVEEALAVVPERVPPTTMRCAGVVGGVEDAGAVAVTAVAPRKVLLSWGASAVPEKI